MKIICAFVISITSFCTTLLGGNFIVNMESSEFLVDSRATPPHTITSFVRKYETDIQIDPGSLAVKSAQISFKLKDLDSENEKRDDKMRGWFQGVKFPEITFTLKDLGEKDGHPVAKGSLSMHGVTKMVEVPYTLTRNGETVILDGSSDFSYEDWDLEIIKLFLFRVRPELKVKFHLEGTLVGK
jgi:polyisoprenoid-binding protein YceI